MNGQNICTLINQQNGNLAFKLFSFSDNRHFDHLQRNNFYTIIWVKEGSGLLKVDFSEYLFQGNTVFAFAPYQPFMLSTDKTIHGIALQFHSDFYCIHRNPQETNCDKVLFNNIYQDPLIQIDDVTERKLNMQFDLLLSEIQNKEEGNNYELIVPHLKICIVTLSRLKAHAKSNVLKFVSSETPFVLESLKNAIEENFKQKHSASDYSSILHISANALNRLVKTHYHKTLTNIITERIIIEAKRELYMTRKPIKVIASHLGYSDEFYFSRVFKNNTGISPQMYRDTVGFAKAELNLHTLN